MTNSLREIIAIDAIRCLGCAQCLNACPNKALKIVKDLAVLTDAALCRGKGRCMTSCKAAALSLVLTEAPEYAPPAAG